VQNTKGHPIPIAVVEAVALMVSGAICLAWGWLEDGSGPSCPATEEHIRPLGRSL
jgi:hypothetical protein